MKKLMTMLAAVASAFGLYATDPVSYGTSFEGIGAGTSIFDVATEGAKWSQVGESNAVVKAYGEIGAAEDQYRPDQFKTEETQERYLDVKTTLGSPLTRTLDSAWDLANGNFYVDTLVRFTNFDEAPTSIDGKIAVWVQEIDNGDNTITTNLMVTAGSDLAGTRKDYVIQNDFEPALEGGWTRVTIKSIKTIRTSGQPMPGFVVYINNEQVGSVDGASKTDINKLGVTLTSEAQVYNNVNALFLSMVQGQATINAVAFDGQGQIDEVSLTSVAPAIAPDPMFFTIGAKDNKVESIEVTSALEGVKTYAFADLPATIQWDGAETFTVKATYVDGYIDGEWTADEDVEVTQPNANHTGYFKPTDEDQSGTIVAQAALVKIGDKSYATLADALADTDALIAAKGKVDIAAPLTLTSALTVNVTAGEPAEAISVILDLAGNTITYAGTTTFAITAGTPLTILDSKTGGKIAAAKAVTSSGSLTIESGIFGGDVEITAGEGAITGGTFDGAFTSATAGVVTDGQFKTAPAQAAIADGLEPKLNEETQYYDIVKKTYTIKYYDDEAASYEELTGLKPDSYQKDDDITLATPEKSGYEFVKWLDMNTDQPFEYTVGMTGNIEVYAEWTAKTYTILFISGEGELTTNDYTKAYGETIEAPTPATVTGKSFKEWNPVVVSPVEGDAEYTAIYTNNIYAITYTYVDDNGETVPGVVNGNPTSFEFGTGIASFDAALLTGYDMETYTFEAFTPASIATDATAPATIKVTFVKKSGDWPTPDPEKPEAEAVAEAMTKAGFSPAAAAAIGTKTEYTAFQGYCDAQSIIPSEVGAAKDNAILTYALGADACNEAITSEDITITAYDQATGKLTVEIEGVTAGETINSAVLAKVLTAKGGAELEALSTDNVNVTGYASAAGEVEVTVTPKAENPAAFFYQIELVK